MRLKIEVNVISGAVITGKNSCDWCKPPAWPYNPEYIAEFCGCMATRGFKRAVREASKEAFRQLKASGLVTNEILVNMGEPVEEMERDKEKEDG